MDREDVRRGIARSWREVDGLGLGETFSGPMPLSVNVQFRDLLLSSGSSYRSVYLAGLEMSHYNFLLADYSFFQFGWDSEDKVRYAYYPNPFAVSFLSETADLAYLRAEVRAGMITNEEYLEVLQEAPFDPRVPTVRYENAPDQFKGLAHPCSHFHFGHLSEDRWPLNRILTPLAFTLLILKFYYGDLWRARGDDASDQSGNKFDSKLIEEKTGCSLVPNDLFSVLESRSFFLA